MGLTLLLSIAACTEQRGDDVLKNYSKRLTHTLNIEQPTLSLPAVAPLAGQRELRQPLPDIRIDLIDAHATRHCSLDMLIGERNSALGRLYPPSKQLSYELRLLKRLQKCFTQDWSHNTDLLQQLQQIYQVKQQSIHIAFNNMLVSDDTLRKELVGHSTLLAVKDVAGFNETVQALTLLQTIQTQIASENWQAASSHDIEQPLQVLYHYNFLGRLQYSLRYSAHWLAQINEKLAGVSTTQLCRHGPQTEQLAITGNLFRRFFIPEVQQYMTDLTRYQQQLWPLLHSLYQDTALLPALEQRYNHSYQQMREQLNWHVQWWQTLNTQCGLKLTG